jgi:hypothetical protein
LTKARWGRGIRGISSTREKIHFSLLGPSPSFELRIFDRGRPAQGCSGLLLLRAAPRCSCSGLLRAAPAQGCSALLLLRAAPRCSCSGLLRAAPGCLTALSWATLSSAALRSEIVIRTRPKSHFLSGTPAFSANLKRKTCFLRGGHFFDKSPVGPGNTGYFFYAGENPF